MKLIHRDRSSVTPSDALRRQVLGWPEQLAHLMEDAAVPVEELLDDGHLVVRASAAGLDPDQDIDIEVSDGNLRISVERRQEARDEDAEGDRSEIRYGHFVRNVPLPAGTSSEDVTATYVDGVLEVRLPVEAEAVETTRIPVTRG